MQTKKMIVVLFGAVLLSLLIVVAIAPAQSVSFDDGATLTDFVIDNDGLAWFKLPQYGKRGLKPDEQAKFIADKGSVRGSNTLHPTSHWMVEQVAADAIQAFGSQATFRIEWVNAVGTSGGYQLNVTGERGSRQVSCAQIACWRMLKGRRAAAADLQTALVGVL